MAAEPSAAAAEPNRIMVYLRIRPSKRNEINEAEGYKYFFDIGPNHKTTTLVDIGKTYEFDWVFEGDSVQQEELYTRVAVPVIDNVFKGFWGTMMVYGQTGSGKSFTMCNFEVGQQGIIPRTMKGIFDRVAEDSSRVYTICFSFIQIYLDKLQDLFNPEETKELQITRDATGVQFPGIKEHVVTSEDHFRQLYENGNQYRVVCATKMNPVSSRGHAALFIQIKSVPRDDPGGEVRNGKLFMIDLAGYERFSKTGVQEGKMKEEAKTINASLLSLGNVVSALSERSEHVPWRNAKLTRMLEDAIGGRAKCSIILTAGPSSEHQYETLGTMYFGSRAMAVKTNAKLAVNIDYQKLAKKLQEMLNAAENKITGLEAEAAKRQLEREELESRFQSEWANVKKRQEDALQDLLKNGATPDKIQEAINANRMETELLEEQHYVQRSALQEVQEEIVKQQLMQTQQDAEADEERVRTGANLDLGKLQRELKSEREEKEKWKAKAKEAETEARRLLCELNEEKLKSASNLGDLGGGAPGSPRGAGGVSLSTGEMRKEMERRIESVKEMLEEQHMLKLQEVEEPLREELERIKASHAELKASFDDQVMAQKDALTQMYEEELATTRKHSVETQEKLKKNHMTIKKSYQQQNQQLQEENEQLLRQVADLTSKCGGDAGAASSGGEPKRVGVPSLADVMIMKKQSEKKVEELSQKIGDLQADLEYANTEKQGLKKQLDEYEPKAGEERLKPAVVRRLKEDFEKMQNDKKALETELFKLKAAQALSGPQKLTSSSTEEDEEDPLDAKEDISGDFEGMIVFNQKLLKFPYFAGAQKIVNNHDAVLNSLTTDLDDYRRAMRLRMFFLGDTGSGKSSVVKCFVAAGPSLIKSAPEVTPTLHPVIHSGSIDDTTTPKGDLHKLYVKFEDVEERTSAGSSQGGGLFGGMASLVGLGSNGVSDPSKVYVDIVDNPGAASFWRGGSTMFLPGKNAVYCITYKLTSGVDAIKEEITRYIELVHATSARSYPKNIGGDTPRVVFCLIGTHRDGLRDSKDAAVVALLNRVTLSLGDVFYRLRGESVNGLVCIGNFAISCRDWTVTSSKGARGPQTLKDLFSWLTLMTNQVNPIRPSTLLPSARETVAHSSYMIGDDKIEAAQEKTSQLDSVGRRFNRGIVTLLSLLFRESKVRWILDDKELRTIVGEHLGVSDGSSAASIGTINFVIRELLARGIIASLPHIFYESKYLPKAKDDYAPDEVPLPRDGTVILDPSRFLVIYSAFLSPRSFADLPQTLPALKDKAIALYDTAALAKHAPLASRGLIPQELGQLLLQRFLGFTCQDIKLMYELLCVIGLGVCMKSELTMLSPAHFSRYMTSGFVDYLSFLVSCHGDGAGRKYELNAAPPAFFARLQLKLMPFSHVPAKDSASLELNWADGSYLCFDKSRLKHGVFASRAAKEAVMQLQLPARGILRLEGNNIYVAITSRGSSPAALNAVKPLLQAVHHEIVALCKREFRGVTASFQEMTIGGWDGKKGRLQQGISAILSRCGASVDEIRVQQGIVGSLSDPKGVEIDNALAALPAFFVSEDA